MEDKNSNINGNQQPNTPQKKGPKFNIWWVYGLFAIALIVLNFWGKDFTHNTKEETFQNINSKFISKNLVDSMVVYPKSVDVYLKKDSLKNGNHDDLLKLFKDNEKGPHYTFTIGNVAVSYTHLRAHETVLDLVCRLMLAKNNNTTH